MGKYGIVHSDWKGPVHFRPPIPPFRQEQLYQFWAQWSSNRISTQNMTIPQQSLMCVYTVEMKILWTLYSSKHVNVRKWFLMMWIDNGKMIHIVYTPIPEATICVRGSQTILFLKPCSTPPQINSCSLNGPVIKVE